MIGDKNEKCSAPWWESSAKKAPDGGNHAWW
jgi:hypothetical protein